MPAAASGVFFGHGNPMNALLRNSFAELWAEIGESCRGQRRFFVYRHTGTSKMPP